MSDSEEYPGLVLCYQCHRWVPADQESEEIDCCHDWAEASDDSDLSGKQTAMIIHDACKRYKENHEDVPLRVAHEYMSTTFDLAINGDLSDDESEYLADHMLGDENEN